MLTWLFGAGGGWGALTQRGPLTETGSVVTVTLKDSPSLEK